MSLNRKLTRLLTIGKPKNNKPIFDDNSKAYLLFAKTK